MVNRLNKWRPDQVSGVELELYDYDKLEEATYRIADEVSRRPDPYGADYCVLNVEQLNPQIFAWLGILDVNIWVILILMTGVAGFTMVSGLLIIIIERTSMIGVLKSLGANNLTIRKLFLWLAVFLIGKGMLWGNVIGLAFYFIQKWFGLFRLDPETYYMDTVPVSFNIWIFLLLNVGTLLASVIMLLGRHTLYHGFIRQIPCATSKSGYGNQIPVTAEPNPSYGTDIFILRDGWFSSHGTNNFIPRDRCSHSARRITPHRGMYLFSHGIRFSF